MKAGIYLVVLVFGGCQASPAEEAILSLEVEPISWGKVLCRLENRTNDKWDVSGYSTTPPRPVPIVEYWNGSEWEEKRPLRCGTGLDPLRLDPGETWEFELSAIPSQQPRVTVLAWNIDRDGRWKNLIRVRGEIGEN